MSPRNTGRSNAARFALRSHQWAKGDAIEDGECAVIDLLADLRHCCEQRGWCFDDLDRMAHQHYVAERQGGGS